MPDVNGLIENLKDAPNHSFRRYGIFVPNDKKRIIQNKYRRNCEPVNAAIEKGIQDFVHVSSVSALGKF
jgi:hypothetical protein